jgi:hypothetical protein
VSATSRLFRSRWLSSRYGLPAPGASMFQAITRTLPRRYQATAVVLGLGVVAGWSLLSGSRGSTAEPERQVSAPAAALRAGQSPTPPERNQAQSPATEIAASSMASGFAQTDIARLAHEKVLVQPKPVTARPPLQAVSSAGRQPQTRVPQAGLMARKPPTPPQVPVRRIRTAQAEPAPAEGKR